MPRALLRYPLRADEALARVAAPVALIHGDADDVVPFAHSERPHARFPHTRRVRIAGGGHNDLPAFAAFHDALREALAAR